MESCKGKSTSITKSVTSFILDIALVMLSEIPNVGPDVAKLETMGKTAIRSELLILVGGCTGQGEVQGHLMGLKRRHSQGLGDGHETSMVTRTHR